MTRKRSSEYVAAPEIPRELRERYDAILAALYGSTSVSDAAEKLGLARNRFQTIMHRAQAAFVEAMSPQAAGRPPTKSDRERTLEAEVATLRREVTRLKEHLDMAESLFGAAGEMMRGIRQRARGKKRAKTTTPTDDAEPVTPTKRLPRWMGQMRAELGRDLLARASRARLLSAENRAAVEELVRATHGLIGADAIRAQLGVVSRRQALAIKRDVLAANERNRKRARARVHVHIPGAIRGFDAMYVATTAGMRYLLVCADASIQYRTTVVVAERYDEASVAAALAADIERHGAPLAYRFDRAKCHETATVRALLGLHGVLALQGPPHHPWYYGQLERQNREHREWLDGAGVLNPDALEAAVPRMMHALNALWPRRTLNWSTSEARWGQRPPITVNRRALQAEVARRTARLREQAPESLARRLAIETALKRRGLLTIQPGGRC